MPALLEARSAGLAGRWDESVRILGPMASQPSEFGDAWYVAGMSSVRCFYAEALEELGQADSATYYLERVTTDPDPSSSDADGIARGALVPFAHRRLVLLYARMGRLADAERHLAILERWWDRPDDIARRMLDEARSAVCAARGMARPEGRGT